MNVIRVVVADDQPMARERLLSLIEAEPDVDVAATAASGPEAVECIRQASPDLVFLDMQMPGMDGFAVIRAIGLDRMPATIFVTAYEEYAVRAFEVHAVDYLLKPFGRPRFQAAIARVRRLLLRGRGGDVASGPAEPIRLDRPSAGSEHERLLVRSSGRINFIDPVHIDWVEAHGNYVRIHAAGEVHVMRGTMAGITSRLGSEHFARIHRSRIVNLRRVKELQLEGSGQYYVLLVSGERIRLSRIYRQTLQDILQGPPILAATR